MWETLCGNQLRKDPASALTACLRVSSGLLSSLWGNLHYIPECLPSVLCNWENQSRSWLCSLWAVGSDSTWFTCCESKSSSARRLPRDSTSLQSLEMLPFFLDYNSWSSPANGHADWETLKHGVWKSHFPRCCYSVGLLAFGGDFYFGHKYLHLPLYPKRRGHIILHGTEGNTFSSMHKMLSHYGLIKILNTF